MKRVLACGSWPSPLSVEQAAGAQRRFLQPRISGGAVYWLEGRPEEGGRVVLMRARDGHCEELTPRPFSVRTRAHEYGGGAYAPAADGVYFCNDADQCIYRAGAGTPQRITVPGPYRFADLVPDPARQRLLAVAEDTSDTAYRDLLVGISLADGKVAPLREDADFFSSPTLSPDGTTLAWVSWDNPQMPWDGSELWLAELTADGSLHGAHSIAGGAQESVFQPCWSPDGVLYLVSDRTGYWNLYRYAGGDCQEVCPDRADYGYAQWVFGMSAYGFLSAEEIAAVRVQQGRSQLVRVHVPTRQWQALDSRYSHIEHLDVAAGSVAMVAGAADKTMGVVAGRPPELTPLGEEGFTWPPANLSSAEALSFPTSDGEQAQLWYYPPCNAEYQPRDELPPLILRCHGGPTSMNGDALDARIQFWTSRGFAFADLNYRGSTGFGRAYRQSLAGQWGVKDVEDCAHALMYLAATGRADPRRAAVSGSSAGGFTALAAVAFRDVFQACSVQYGISELETAMRDTHRFEARYGDTLLGPWPEARHVYRARSPLYAADRIKAPVIFFQGSKDKVVLPDQTVRMLHALRERGVPAACVLFPEEGHGFRRADTLRQVLAAELAFYARVFGFTPADAVPVLELGTES
ncbi:MAG TPA: prolyl oligopeptidase family serine peptidase [Gammaproteobacteria bacterium]|nr:prolyl oligopeptidase family serine peptidase [Gammaproteobacteria bacterium]